MDPLQQGESSIDIQRRCARQCTVLQNLCVCISSVSIGLNIDWQDVGAVASSSDVNVRSCDGGQGSIVCTAAQRGWDLVHQINCDLLQREAIVIGISHTDVEWNGHVEALG